MKNNLLLILSIFFLLSSHSYASIEITSFDLKKFGDRGKLNISYKGIVNNYPELTVNEREVRIIIPNANIKQKVSKSFQFSTTNTKDTQIFANNAGKSVELKVVFPYSLQGLQEQVSLMIKDNAIEMVVPHKLTTAKVAQGSPKNSVVDSAKKDLKKEYLDEKYLDTLIKETEQKKSDVKLDTNSEFADQESVNKSTSNFLTAAENESNSNSSVSLVEYGGKFVAFLGLVMLFFYAIVTLMKKGFIKKGKLSFLNKTDQIQVISQTHIAPKKSLMMIKAHNQVFLVSNTDAGIHPISEIRDAAHFLKDSERKVAGNNFDDSIFKAKDDELLENKITLKSDITKSNKESSLSDYLGIKDQVKFSDQIKKKVKSLKSLQ